MSKTPARGHSSQLRAFVAADRRFPLPAGAQTVSLYTVVSVLRGRFSRSGYRPTITKTDVGVEEAYMVATMKNLAAAYNQSVEWTIEHNQYGGYHKGWQLLNDYLDVSPTSDECDHLITAIAALRVGGTLNLSYTQWRAARNSKGKPVKLRGGAIRIAGTDFF